ncbi:MULTISPECIES: DUF397 domain-containing protein [unclassified Kitasatospora]
MADRVDLADAQWFKSSYSNNGGTCVEVAPGFPGVRSGELGDIGS